MTLDVSSNLGVLVLFLCVSLTVTKEIQETTLIGHNIPFFECRALCCESNNCRSFQVEVPSLACYQHASKDQEAADVVNYKETESQETPDEGDFKEQENQETADVADYKETKNQETAHVADYKKTKNQETVVLGDYKESDGLETNDKTRRQAKADMIDYNDPEAQEKADIEKQQGIVTGSCMDVRKQVMCPVNLNVQKDQSWKHRSTSTTTITATTTRKRTTTTTTAAATTTKRTTTTTTITASTITKRTTTTTVIAATTTKRTTTTSMTQTKTMTQTQTMTQTPAITQTTVATKTTTTQTTTIYEEKEKDVIKIGDWLLLFRGTADINQSVYDLWMNDVIVQPNRVEPGCLTLKTSSHCIHHFKSKLITRWGASNFEMVKYLILKNDTVKAEIQFEAIGSSKTNWFSSSRVINSSWTGLKSSSSNFFSIEGNSNNHRFSIKNKSGGCSEEGWTTTIDRRARQDGACDWDRKPSFPKFMFSKLDGKALLKDMDYADAIVVLAKKKSYEAGRKKFTPIENMLKQMLGW